VKRGQTGVKWEKTMAGSVFDFKLTTLKGDAYWLADLRGRPLLIVNTASKCGFTPQYAGLQALWMKWEKQKQGPVVIGVPSNDFGNQEPGEAQAIGEFCERNYGVTFPMMEKCMSKGPTPIRSSSGLGTRAASCRSRDGISTNT
jgi:glutathione peroxidase